MAVPSVGQPFRFNEALAFSPWHDLNEFGSALGLTKAFGGYRDSATIGFDSAT